MTLLMEDIDRMEALLEAQDIAELILKSEEMRQYIDTKEALQQDPVAQEQIRGFEQVKDSYEDVQRFGAYHPDYDSINKRVREMKGKVQHHQTIQDFRKAENALEDLLYQVCRTIADGVSTAIKVPSDNPFNNLGGGCGSSGGCGSGGSCGCG